MRSMRFAGAGSAPKSARGQDPDQKQTHAHSHTRSPGTAGFAHESGFVLSDPRPERVKVQNRRPTPLGAGRKGGVPVADGPVLLVPSSAIRSSRPSRRRRQARACRPRP
jgi:hypothetical protein